MVTGWEPIANYDDDFNIAYNNSLAEEIEAIAADNFVVRLKQGIEFHNGKTVSAEDLIYCSIAYRPGAEYCSSVIAVLGYQQLHGAR